MGTLRTAAVSAPFGRDLVEGFVRVTALVAEAREDGVGLLVLPEAALGGYLTGLAGQSELPPALDPDGREIVTLAAPAGDMVACVGYCEQAPDSVYDSGVRVTGAVEAARAGTNVLRDRRPGTYAAPDGTPSEAA